MRARRRGRGAAIADLFAGLGTFTLAARATYAAEASRDAAAALKRAAPQVAVEHRDLYRRPLDRRRAEAVRRGHSRSAPRRCGRAGARARRLDGRGGSPTSAAIPRPSRAMRGRSSTAATRSIGSGRSASSAGRPTSSSRPASPVVDEEDRRVGGEADQAQRRKQEDKEADPDDVHRRLDDAVHDPQARHSPTRDRR